MLARTIFSKVLRFNISPKIDLFASRLNNQLTCVLETRSKGVRSRRILLRLEQLQSYAFPLFSCISQCVQKIKTDKAEGMLLIPHWPTQPFYSEEMKMTKGLPVIILSNAENLVRLNHLKSLSTVAAKTDLMVCHVLGRDL